MRTNPSSFRVFIIPNFNTIIFPIYNIVVIPIPISGRTTFIIWNPLCMSNNSILGIKCIKKNIMLVYFMP